MKLWWRVVGYGNDRAQQFFLVTLGFVPIPGLKVLGEVPLGWRRRREVMVRGVAQAGNFGWELNQQEKLRPPGIEPGTI